MVINKYLPKGEKTLRIIIIIRKQQDQKQYSPFTGHNWMQTEAQCQKNPCRLPQGANCHYFNTMSSFTKLKGSTLTKLKADPANLENL